MSTPGSPPDPSLPPPSAPDPNFKPAKVFTESEPSRSGGTDQRNQSARNR